MNKPDNCLFFSESPSCSGSLKEHLLNESIFGSLASNEVICEECNSYFSRTIDIDFSRFLSPFITLLAPVTVGRDSASYLTKTNRGKDVIMSSRGNVEPQKSITTRKNKKDPSKDTIIFDRSRRSTVINDILPNKYNKANYTESYFDIREELGDTVFTPPYSFRNVTRGALLDILETQNLIEKRIPGMPAVSSSSGLAKARKFVRNDRGAKIPFMPTCTHQGIFETILPKRNFSHSILIASAPNTDNVILAASYFGINPFFFRMRHTGIKESFTNAYQKDILNGESDWLVSTQCMIPDIEFKGPFRQTTVHSFKKSTTDFEQSLNEAYGKARIYVDLNDPTQADELNRELAFTGNLSMEDKISQAALSRYRKDPNIKRAKVIAYDTLNNNNFSNFTEGFQETVHALSKELGPPKILVFDEEPPN